MEYLQQAKKNMAAMQAAAEMQANQAEMAYALRARMEELDALAATTSSPGPKVVTSLTAEDRYRFGLDSTHGASKSAKAQPAPREQAPREPRRSGGEQVHKAMPVGPSGPAPRGMSLTMDEATADLIRKLEACGEHENAKKLRASFAP